MECGSQGRIDCCSHSENKLHPVGLKFTSFLYVQCLVLLLTLGCEVINWPWKVHEKCIVELKKHTWSGKLSLGLFYPLLSFSVICTNHGHILIRDGQDTYYKILDVHGQCS